MHILQTFGNTRFILQVGEKAETMLEKLLLRLNEQGLEVSSPWVVNQEQLVVESTIPLFSSGNVIFFQREIPHRIGGLKCRKMLFGLKRD